MNAIEAFSRHAHTYEDHATVQKRVAHRLLECLPSSAQIREILELGCGTGHFSDLVLQKHPTAHMTLLDPSEAMLEQVRRRPWSSQVNLIQTCAEQYRPEGPQDLIVSSSAAQWFSHPIKDLKRYQQFLRPGGTLAFSVYVEGTLQEWNECVRESCKRHGLAAPAHQGLLSIARWQNWSDLRCFTETHTLLYPDAFQALKAIQRTGAAGSDVQLPAHVMREAIRIYGSRYPEGVPVTYQVFYGKVQK
ncbi:methyltransferase domain-containing protein [Deinococcus cellulosilyticus]|uniref:Malonyl-[acyl-carrier protein] O-methyltransferase n=1 Tax=Deinococcus cellulosilyticus (strain DSM 18568 / NBRC 106333 / KACC 11606 / 5516J-15) TaxID=1223518 RepID=A0A511N103_DEIC1|nr:methyltransferase domain-containing protein [Deinococcus cellulosilyticus]GEM46056.1 malonyl-[acyl-carrier protein] O-methyltransferase [Deinococcus cellulosilyticus NBRC 106333 = KACC 11606]